MIHVFFAERAVARVPGIPKDTATYPIAKVGIIGAGTMGGGIAMACANAGISRAAQGNRAGGARPRHGGDSQELRKLGQERADFRRQ